MRHLLLLLALLGLLLPGAAPAGADETEADAPSITAPRSETDAHWLVRNLRFALDRARRKVLVDRSVGVYLGRGVFPPSAIAVVRRLDEGGTSPRLLFEDDLRWAGLQDLRLLIVPGGWAPSQRDGLGEEGQEAIRLFVERGGHYVGICAGAFLACTNVVWKGEHLAYPLKLVAGAATGPLPERAPWPNSEGLEVRAGEETHRVLYAGGCSFEADDATVYATYADGSPAALAVRHGKGAVLVVGVHAEFAKSIDADLLAEGDWATDVDPGNARLFRAWLKRVR